MMKVFFNFLKNFYGYIYFQSWRFGLWTPPDRIFLTQKIFAEILKDDSIKKILFVGVQDYCRDYKNYFLGKKEFWTIDSDSKNKAFGADHHLIGDIQDLSKNLESDFRFEAILMNGVIGYGLDSKDKIEQALKECANRLNDQGWLIIGLNPEMNLCMSPVNIQKTSGLALSLFLGLGMNQINIRSPFLFDLSHSFYFYQKRGG